MFIIRVKLYLLCWSAAFPCRDTSVEYLRSAMQREMI